MLVAYLETAALVVVVVVVEEEVVVVVVVVVVVEFSLGITRLCFKTNSLTCLFIYLFIYLIQTNTTNLLN
jgi:hypothetical protein